MADQPKPLMPHATATWLVDNTGLSFEQIAEFCGLHILEVQAMADAMAADGAEVEIETQAEGEAP